jgi:dihydrofolate synthase / folylpolyglutamate synthase
VKNPPTYAEITEWLYARRRTGPRGPERTQAILERLGEPQTQFDAIHVVGTNGKGSVCAMLDAGLRLTLDAGLRAAHLRVGRFTSPHLKDFRERIVVDGQEIPEADVLEFARWAEEHAQDGAFFDLTVALAFKYFADQRVDIAVVESGVGGQSDATMSLDRVKLLVLTNVDFDHVETLGPGLRDIARDKSGAIRAGVPVVTAAMGDALAVIRSRAIEREAPLYALDETDPLFALPRAPRLQGRHQLENAHLAVAALRLLGYGESSVLAALEASWPARFEVFELDGRTVIVDGAHNPAGAHALADSLRPGFALIFGAFERKNAHAVLDPLQAHASSLMFVAPPGGQAASPQLMALEHGGMAFDTPESAFQHALNHTSKGAQIVVTGSLYLAGLMREHLIELGAVPVDPRETPSQTVFL